MEDQTNASAPGLGFTVIKSPHVTSKDKIGENFEALNLNIRQEDLVNGESQPGLNPPFMQPEFHIENSIKASPHNVEHQFIPNFTDRSPVHEKKNQNGNLESKSLSPLRNSPDEEFYVSLQLGDPESKKRKHSNASVHIKDAR